MTLMLQELTIEEQIEIEGGLIPLLIAAGVALVLSSCGNDKKTGKTIVVEDCNGCEVTIDKVNDTVIVKR